MIGTHCDFRPGQWEAIEAMAIHRKRVLVVQRTGWGKSMVYFLATRLLRDSGAGPTLLISPLLSLMRNQIEMANRIGIRAATINSANQSEWEQVEKDLSKNDCDMILISPERLNNERFTKGILPKISGRIGLFVVDEAHCISDWGHDFRPDYRRITRILQILPKNIPVLGTTATANNRVVADVQAQLGNDLLLLRGPLTRQSLRLQNITLSSQSERLAWLVENLPKFSGSGIIYCLTVPDTERVAGWLRYKGFNAEAYHAGEQGRIDRVQLEDDFLHNKVQILVATVALGMGFDKPDIHFVIHFQRPGSVVAYYQQVGRAGRAVEKSYGILLNGVEDDDIQEYFIRSAFPSLEVMQSILTALGKSAGLTLGEILNQVNCSQTVAEKALKLLEVEGAVGEAIEKKVLYFRTPNPWKPDIQRIDRVLDLRREELVQMQAYVSYTGCLMEFLQRALDDPSAKECGRCANCRGKGFPASASHELVVEAEQFLKRDVILIHPRKLWPVGLFPNQKRTIPENLQNAQGRSLCFYGDAGWGKLVRDGKYVQSHFSDELVEAAVELIEKRWRPEPSPAWITAIPSCRHPILVFDLARRLANRLKLPFCSVLQRSRPAPEQKTMENSAMQSRNVIGTMCVTGHVPKSPVLLIDDILDSGWTLTIAGYLLRQQGSGVVHPFTLAKATSRNK
jgi:ATP-dependent DNA helicase RecQ